MREVLLISGCGSHVRIDRRSHEERVAPPPERPSRITRIGRCDLRVETRAHWSDHLRVFVNEVLFHDHLADRQIVCVHRASAGLPVELLSNVEHGLFVFVTRDLVRNRHEACVKRGPRPVHLRVSG